jgi:hypothetical protein
MQEDLLDGLVGIEYGTVSVFIFGSKKTYLSGDIPQIGMTAQ